MVHSTVPNSPLSEDLVTSPASEVFSQSSVTIQNSADIQPLSVHSNSTMSALTSNYNESEMAAVVKSLSFNNELCVTNMGNSSSVSSIQCPLPESTEVQNVTSTQTCSESVTHDIFSLELESKVSCDQSANTLNLEIDNKDYLITNKNIENANSELDVVGELNRTSRFRKDSTGSTDTLESSSSAEIFRSSYTDTVSSTSSVAFLLKPHESSEECLLNVTSLKDIHNNDGYMSCSSTEMLDEENGTDYFKEASDVKEVHLNGDYMSCSSSEVLNEDSIEYTTDYLVSDAKVNEGYSTASSTEALNDDDNSEESPLICPTPTENTTVHCETVVDIDGVKDDNGNGVAGTSVSKPVEDFLHHNHSLIPIEEGQVLSIHIEEVVPSYTKITNNIVVVDESFLHSQTNIGDLETNKRGKRATTMNNLHERSSFLDLTEVSKVGRACQKALIYLKDDITFGSLASLNNIASKEIEKDPSHSISLITGKNKMVDVIASNKHTRNLLALSLCITLLFIAIGSVRNLQSSINHEGGVGVISMAVNCVGYMVGSVFSSVIVQNIQPRTCIIVNVFPNLLYVAANMYPAMWLMVTISAIQGVSMAILWNAMSTYITFLARGCAQKKKEPIDQVSGKFFGIFCLIYQSYLIIGNLIASLVLSSQSDSSHTNPLNSTELMDNVSSIATTQEMSSRPLNDFSIGNISSNETIDHLLKCGGAFCQHFKIGGSGFSVSDETKYLLFGTYIGCILVALVIAVVALEPLNQHLFTSTVRPMQKLKSQMSSLIYFFVDPKFLLLLPLLMYSVVQFGFISAEFTKAFVTCPLGIHMVGYSMICLGVCGSISSYLSGLFSKYLGRTSILLFATLKSLIKMATDVRTKQSSRNTLTILCNGRACG